jgi:hypothetical protein
LIPAFSNCGRRTSKNSTSRFLNAALIFTAIFVGFHDIREVNGINGLPRRRQSPLLTCAPVGRRVVNPLELVRATIVTRRVEQRWSYSCPTNPIDALGFTTPGVGAQEYRLQPKKHRRDAFVP